MTTDRRVPPHDLVAEADLLGAVLISAAHLEHAAGLLEPGDFFGPLHGTVFKAAVELARAGMPADPVTVHDWVARHEPARADDVVKLMADVQANACPSRSVPAYCEIVARHASLRRAAVAATEIADAAYEGHDPDDVRRIGENALEGVRPPAFARPVDVLGVDDWLAAIQARERDRSQWVINGLLRARWRAVIVAAEGVSKSVCLRSAAVAASWGFHPFIPSSRFEGRRVLLVDLENPADIMAWSLGDLDEKARRLCGGERPGELLVMHRESGLDLRSSGGRHDLVSTVRSFRPDLLCMGPLYKAFRSRQRESYELAADEVLDVLDDLRGRYGPAMLFEHHMPKGERSGANPSPFGSARWMYWPEFGLRLELDEHSLNVVKVGRYRRDRPPPHQASWPLSMVRRDDEHAEWVWDASYESGVHDRQPWDDEEF